MDYIKESKEKKYILNKLINNFEEAIVLFDENTNILKFNNSFLKILNTKFKHKVKNTKFLTFIQDSYKKRFLNNLKKIKQNPSVKSKMSEAEIEDYKGNLHKISYKIIPFENIYNMQICFILIIKDITDLKKSNEELTGQIKFNKEVIDTLPGIFLLIDISGKIYKYNNDFVKNFLLSKLKENFFDNFFTGSDKDIAKRSIQKTIIEGNSSFVCSIVNRKGKEKIYFLNLRKIIFYKKILISITGFDITEQKILENQLKESEKIFKTLTETAQDAIIIVDSKGRIVLFNQSAEKIFQYRAEELIRKEVHRIFASKKNYLKAQKGLEFFSRTGTGNIVGKTIELVAKRKNKEIFPIEISTSPLFIKNQWHCVGIIRDISERKKNHNDLMKQKLIVEEKNKELEEKNKKKSELIKGLSHELKTPLANLKMHSEILCNFIKTANIDDEKIDKIIGSMNKSITRTRHIIENLLEIYKLEKIKLDVKVEKIRINDLIKEVLDGYEQKINELNIKVKVEKGKESIYSDKDKLFQVFSNIIDNSIKYCDQNKKNKWIKINIKKEKFIIITIKDNGIGIKQRNKKKIYEPFYQENISSQGIGLGLTIIDKILESLKGKLKVSSKGEGKGTKAEIILPFKLKNEKTNIIN